MTTLWQSILLLASLFSVEAAPETDPSPYPGDSIDDIAIWVNPEDPSQSLILAALKASNQMPRKPLGILVYDLNGKQIQFLEGGSPNNIDIRYGYTHQGRSIHVIAVSHWWHNYVSLLTINPESLKLEELTTTRIDTGMKQVRGLCMYKSPSDEFYYFVLNNQGEVAQFKINDEGQLQAEKVREFKLESVSEGCVVDDYHKQLYIAEKTKGIWKFAADPESIQGKLIIELHWYSSIAADLEGLTIYNSGNGTGYLLVSSQGNDRFAVYDRVSNNHIATFTIDDRQDLDQQRRIDGTSHTDGIEAVSANFGDRFPKGILIAHDDANISINGTSEHQNYKLIDWQSISDRLMMIQSKRQ
ncbi:MAG: phytase [Pseudomonadales bacterium]